MVDEYSIPEADDAVPLETTVKQVRKQLGSRCSMLLDKAKELSLENQKANLKFKSWEGQIDNVRQTVMSTHSLDTLREMNRECEYLLIEMKKFEK